MISALLQAVIAFVLTGIVGSWIAHVWQSRAAKEARFFEASKEIYNQMFAAVDQLSGLVGKRIYASQRVCLVDPNGPSFDDAVSKFSEAVITWNEQLLTLDLAVRTKFRDTSLREFENLQGELARITSSIDSYISSRDMSRRKVLLANLRGLRGTFFEFTQQMMQEARLLHRQMHFGIVVRYDRYEIDKMSTQDLIKCLFTSRVESKPIIRSPSDFGLPVGVWQARLGIYE